MSDNSSDDMMIAIGVDLATIRRGLKKLEQEVGTSTGRVQKQFEVVGRGIDNAMTSAMQNRINAMVGLGAKGAREWTGALADQGKELERLRAKYSPLFATINSYKAAVADIRRAHAVGAISTDEMTSAIQRERQAALASTAAIKGRNAALQATVTRQGSAGSANSFNTSNLAAQGFDVLTTAAFMPWYTVALQQGPQVAQVFNDIREKGQSIGPAVAGAFAQLVNPVTLVTMGVIAATSGLVQYVLKSRDVKSADDLLKGHADTISLLREKYGEAAKGLRDYVRESTLVAKVDLEERLKGAREFVNEQAKVTASFGPGVLTGFASTLKDMDPKIVRDLRVAFADLSASVARGEPDILRFREALSRIADNEAVPDTIRKLAQEYRQFDEETLKVAKSIPGMLDQMKLIEGVAEGQTAAIQRLTNALQDLKKIGVAPLTELQQAEKIWREARRNATTQSRRDEVDRAFEDAKRRIDNANPTILNGDGSVVPVPTPDAKPSVLGEAPDKKTETAAQRAANAYRDLIKSADDRIGQLRLEVELTGQYGVATDAARFRLDLLQQSEDKGRSLSDRQRAEIEQKVALYEKYSRALSETKLQQDLLNQMRFSSLSRQDQQIVTTLRQYGLPEDLGGRNAAMIRQSMQSDEIRDGVATFLGDFKSALLENGGDIGDAFGKALLNNLMKSMDKQWGAIFDLIGSGMSSALGGRSAPAFGAGGVASVASTSASIAKQVSAAIPTTDIAAYITQAAIKRGIDPNIALRVAKSEGGLSSWNLQSNYVKNGIREPSFGPFQLYKGGGLGNAFMAKTGMDPALAANGPAGVDFALDHAARNGWGAWYGAKNAGIGNFEGIGKASKAIEGLGDAATATAKMTEGLGQTLASIPQALMANGGGSGFLSGLTKYGMGLFSGSGQFASAWMKGGIGLFAGGGHVAGPGGPTSDSIPAWLSDGEFVVNARSTRKHRAMLEAINSGRVSRFASGGLVSPRLVSAPIAPVLAPRVPAAANDRGEPGILVVRIDGANGDNHVRTLVRQGVGEGLQQYNKQQERGGFGSLQGRYNSQKG